MALRAGWLCIASTESEICLLVKNHRGGIERNSVDNIDKNDERVSLGSYRRISVASKVKRPNRLHENLFERSFFGKSQCARNNVLHCWTKSRPALTQRA